MSQAIEQSSTPEIPTEEIRPAFSSNQRFEFEYKPVPMLAYISLVLGVLSAISLISILGVGISFWGLIFGAVALWRIRSSRGELGGKKIATIGLALAAIFFVSGGGYHSFLMATEVPDGFERINFTRDISKKGLVVEDGETKPAPDVLALDGKMIFIKGYMYQQRQLEDLESFVLVKDNGVCCFGAQPALTDMIEVEMKDGLTVDDCRMLVSVGGIFRIDENFGTSDLDAIYRLEAVHIDAPAKTSF